VASYWAHQCSVESQASQPPYSRQSRFPIRTILFLFIIGLEVDLRYFLSNWKIALSVSSVGLIIPFSLGAAISYGIYEQFKDEPGTKPIAYGTFLLFIGVAMAITAFPVLCRILTELKLLSTPVGIITLASGVGDDVVGWVLLALCVALVNAGSGLVALYIILCAIGWGLFLAFAVRPCFMWVLHRTNSLQDGPTQGVMVLTILMVSCTLLRVVARGSLLPQASGLLVLNAY
jgi:Kef-type K+ transport system membrane component KefB